MTLPAVALPMQPGADIVAGAAFFSGLAPDQQERIAALGRLETYRQNSAIYNLGDKTVDCYVLVEGMVRFSIGMGSRQAAAGQILRRGELFGWAALVEQAPARIASAVCLTPCSVLAINGDQLLLLMEADHSLGFRLMKRLNDLITGNLTAFASG